MRCEETRCEETRCEETRCEETLVTRGAGPGALIERVRESQAEEMSGRCVGALRWKVVQEVSREVSRTCLGHVQEVSTSAHLPSPTRPEPASPQRMD